jgi:hypothetical protein
VVFGSANRDRLPERQAVHQVTFLHTGPGEHQLTLSDPPYPRRVEEALSGGNTHEAIVRIDGAVHRPSGPWTLGVHALLGHLEELGYDGAPRVRGIDEQGREVLDYVEGEVVHPDHDRLLVPDAALAEVVTSIRRFHDAVKSFADPERFEWSDRGGDPDGPHEIVCHNDLAPWNLVHTPDGRWVFIDWDFAAPGRRSWDLAFALLSMVPLMPQSDLTKRRTAERLTLFRKAYGPDEFPDDVLAVVAERCAREADLIDRLGAAGEPPYDRLLREGHSEIWHAAEAHVVGQTPDWQAALNALG